MAIAENRVPTTGDDSAAIAELKRSSRASAPFLADPFPSLEERRRCSARWPGC